MEVRWELEVERRDCEAVDDTFGFYSPRVYLFSSLCFRVRDRLSIWVCSAYQVLSLRTAAEQLASLFCYLLLLYVYYILQKLGKYLTLSGSLAFSSRHASFFVLRSTPYTRPLDLLVTSVHANFCYCGLIYSGIRNFRMSNPSLCQQNGRKPPDRHLSGPDLRIWWYQLP